MPSAARTRRRPSKAGTRGTPRAERERQILDVAGHEFANRGYHAVSMDDVAEQAGVSKPMIYAYFGSKEGLYLAYVERAGQDLLDRLRAAGNPNLAPQARLRAGVVEFLKFVAERRDGWAVLYAEAAAQGGPLAGRIAGLRLRITSIVERLLRETVGDGLGAAEQARVEGAAHALVGAGESLANWWLDHPEIEVEEVSGWLLNLEEVLLETDTERPARRSP
jgi:AcrR family transcriptional regulator